MPSSNQKAGPLPSKRIYRSMPRHQTPAQHLQHSHLSHPVLQSNESYPVHSVDQSHQSRPVYPIYPTHSTIPDFSVSTGPVSNLSRANAPHSLDVSQLAVAVAAEGLDFYPHQAPIQGKQSIPVHNAYHSPPIPEVAGNSGGLENIYPHSSTAGFMHNNSAHADVRVPMMPNNMISYSNADPSMNLLQPSYENLEYNHYSSHSTQRYKSTQADSDFGLLVIPGMGDEFVSYSQPELSLYHSLRQQWGHHVIHPSPTDPISRIESGQYTASSPLTLASYPEQQWQDLNDHFLPVDSSSCTPGQPGPPILHSPFTSELQPHTSREGRINHRLPAQAQVHQGGSLHHHTFRNQALEAHSVLCRWVSCDFTGPIDELKAHVNTYHLSGSQDEQTKCQWEGCQYRKRGQSSQSTMRRDSVKRHITEMHLGDKYRKKKRPDS